MEGAQTGASPTPILDRREPLPPAVGSRSWLAGLVIVGGIGAMFGVGLALDQPEFLRRVPPGSLIVGLFELSPWRFGLTLLSEVVLALSLQLCATILAARFGGFRPVRSRWRLRG